MGRYIDADALIKKIYPLGIGEGMYVINAKAVKFAIDNTPTADVAPKSEVDTLQERVKRLMEVNDGFALALLYECKPTKERLSELEKFVRKKVANEIFAEL